MESIIVLHFTTFFSSLLKSNFLLSANTVSTNALLFNRFVHNLIPILHPKDPNGCPGKVVALLGKVKEHFQGRERLPNRNPPRLSTCCGGFRALYREQGVEKGIWDELKIMRNLTCKPFHTTDNN